MPNVQIITTPTGDELVILPRTEYEALLARADDAAEEESDIAIYDARMAELAAGEAEILPAEISAALLKGASRLRAIRIWRGTSQSALAAQAGIGQGYLSDLESRRRAGSAETLEKLADILNVPRHWLTP